MRKKEQIHTMRIFFLFLTGKVTSWTLHNWSPMNQWITSVSAWLESRGRYDARFIHTGSKAIWHRLMDDSALFCLTCRTLSPTLDVPGRALAWCALLAFSYQSTGIMLTVCNRGIDIQVLPHCLLFSADTLHNDSVCSTDASQREQRVSDSNSCIYGR